MPYRGGFGNIDEAADGREALILIDRTFFATVILDWNMSPTSGLDLLMRLCSQPRTAAIPFIKVTVKSQKRFGITAPGHGVAHDLEKPFTGSDLRGRVCRAIARASAAMLVRA